MKQVSDEVIGTFEVKPADEELLKFDEKAITVHSRCFVTDIAKTYNKLVYPMIDFTRENNCEEGFYFTASDGNVCMVTMDDLTRDYERDPEFMAKMKMILEMHPDVKPDIERVIKSYRNDRLSGSNRRN